MGFDTIPYQEVVSLADSCIEEALYTNLTGVLKENNANLEDSDAMFKVAQVLHRSLIKNCNGFRQFSRRIATQEVEEVKQENKTNVGLLYQLNTNQQFPIFTILTEDNQALDFVWFREFDGSTRFMNGIKAYQHTVVEIVWRDIELYDVVTQKYPFYKEIILIEELRVLENKERKAWIKGYQQKLRDSGKKRKEKR